MGRFYVDSRNDMTLHFPNDTNRKQKKNKQKKLLGRATNILHTPVLGINSGPPQLQAMSMSLKTETSSTILTDKKKRYNQNQSCFIQAVISSNYVEINQQKLLAVSCVEGISNFVRSCTIKLA